jgi:hypothetical protein
MNCWLNCRDAGPTNAGAKYATGNVPVTGAGAGGGVGTGDEEGAGVGAADGIGAGGGLDCVGVAAGVAIGLLAHQTSTSPAYSMSLSAERSVQSAAIPLEIDIAPIATVVASSAKRAAMPNGMRSTFVPI